MLAADTGMRCGEIFRLRWDAIDWRNGGIMVIRSMSGSKECELPKEGKRKFIPWSPRIQARLDELHKGVPPFSQDFIFKYRDRGVWQREVNKAFRDAADACGFPRAKFHHIRHTFVTRAINEGLTTAQAGALVGHTDAKTTMRYTRINVKEMQRMEYDGEYKWTRTQN